MYSTVNTGFEREIQVTNSYLFNIKVNIKVIGPKSLDVNSVMGNITNTHFDNCFCEVL